MADGTLQKSRSVRLTTPLGPDGLLFYKMTGAEGISGLFEWTVEALAPDEAIEEHKVVGHGCTVEIECADDQIRYFHGICSAIDVIGVIGHKIRYQLTLRPHLWFLKLQSDSRIFSDMKVGEIISEVLDDAGLTDHQIILKEEHEKIHYCVQYQESNYAFICRLMEKYGIFFFFKFQDDRHTLIITDAQTEIKTNDGADILQYNPEPGLLYPENCVSELKTSGQIASDEISANEYDYENVGKFLKVTQSDPGQHGMTGNALYDFRTCYVSPSVGEHVTRVSLQAERAQTQRINAIGTAPALFAGCKLKITESPLPAAEVDLTCVSATHLVTSDSYRTGGDQEQTYRGTYEMMPWDTPFRAPKVTPWPQISGHHTAIVVGKDGEEIDVDDQGRILVHFHWERAGKRSRRLRIANPLAGANYGIVNIPRIGHEVLVSYVDGDPDRPQVVGSVYNSKNTHPIPMPASKTQMGMRSNSSKGGGGANEIIMEDGKDGEKLAMIAERDHTFEIKNDADIKVGYGKNAPGSYNLEVFKDRTEKVSTGDYTLGVDAGNRSATIATNDTLNVGASQTENIAVNRTKSIGAADVLAVGGPRNETVAMTRTTQVGASDSLAVGASRSVDVATTMATSAKDISQTAGATISHSAKDAMSSSSKKITIDGSDSISINSKKISITADTQIVLKVGSSKITMSKNAITMKASKISEN